MASCVIHRGLYTGSIETVAEKYNFVNNSSLDISGVSNQCLAFYCGKTTFVKTGLKTSTFLCIILITQVFPI